MRLSSATLLICAAMVLWICRNSLSAVDSDPESQQPADQTEKPTTKIRSSDKAIVKDVVYGLEEEENRLYLTSQPLDGVDRKLEREELKFLVAQDSHVAELSLAKLDGKNLMAVIKVAREKEYDFYCLTFIAPPEGHIRSRYGFHQAKFFTTRDNLKILAVGGKHFRGSVFIVLGDIVPDVNDVFVTVTEGVFYFSLCPWPPSDGQLSPFRAESVRPKDRPD